MLGLHRPGIGTLVFRNYTFGNNLNLNNFVSFTYHSDLLDLALIGTGSGVGRVSYIAGNFAFHLPGGANIEMFEQGEVVFGSLRAGNWYAVAATPLPAALPLLIGGLGAFGLLGLGRSRKNQAN